MAYKQASVLYPQVILSVTCTALAVWLYNDTNFADMRCLKGFPVDRWLMVVAAIAPLYGLARILSSLLLMLSEFAFEHLQHVHYVILGLWWPLTCAPP